MKTLVPGCLRAQVPVRGDPLKVKVQFRPQNVGNPSAVVLLGSGQPFGVFDQDRGAEGRSIFSGEAIDRR